MTLFRKIWFDLIIFFASLFFLAGDIARIVLLDSPWLDIWNLILSLIWLFNLSWSSLRIYQTYQIHKEGCYHNWKLFEWASGIERYKCTKCQKMAEYKNGLWNRMTD